MGSSKNSRGVPNADFQQLDSDVDALRREARKETAQLEEESRQRRLAGVLADQASLPATINELRIHGAVKTRRSFLDPIFKPIVADSQNSDSTLAQLLDNLRIASGKLDRLGIFQPQPAVFLQQADQTDPSSSPTDLDIDVRVRELKSFKFTSGTNVGNSEGSAYGNLVWRNIFGGAETLEVNAAAGTRTRLAYNGVLSAPLLSNPDLRLSLEGLTSTTDNVWASHEEVLKGGSLRLSWLSKEQDVHTMEYAGLWRQLTGLGATASPSVRNDAGDSVKSALKHTFRRERRDNPALPQRGYLLRSALELAGVGPLGGDVGFGKGEVEVGGAVPVPLPGLSGPTGISLGGGFRMGLLYPLALGWDLSGKALPSRINDRFLLGGPTDVRGFKLGGLGPRDGVDGLGGDVFAAGSVNLLLPVPYRGPESGLRFQLFANGGRLVALRHKGKAKETGPARDGPGLDARSVWDGTASAVRELGNGLPSVAAGAGLVYAHGPARFELNFSLPLVMRRGEQAIKGLQVGVGISFL